MVTHDYERGVITGLPRSVVAEARRTGRFPREAMHPVMAQVWERLSGGRVPPPSGFLDSLMCSCREAVSERFRVGSACCKTAKDVGIFYADTECADHGG